MEKERREEVDVGGERVDGDFVRPKDLAVLTVEGDQKTGFPGADAVRNSVQCQILKKQKKNKIFIGRKSRRSMFSCYVVKGGLKNTVYVLVALLLHHQKSSRQKKKVPVQAACKMGKTWVELNRLVKNKLVI